MFQNNNKIQTYYWDPKPNQTFTNDHENVHKVNTKYIPHVLGVGQVHNQIVANTSKYDIQTGKMGYSRMPDLAMAHIPKPQPDVIKDPNVFKIAQSTDLQAPDKTWYHPNSFYGVVKDKQKLANAKNSMATAVVSGQHTYFNI